MNRHGLTALEYPRVKEMVLACLRSPCGQRAAGTWVPLDEAGPVEGLLEETAQMVLFLDEEGEIELDDVTPPEEILESARPRGAALIPAEILSIGRICQAGRLCRSRLNPLRDRFPVLSAIAGSLPVMRELEKEINGILDEEGEFRDNASETFSRIRKELAAARDEINRLYRKLLTDGGSRDLFQEDIVTTRQGRYVLMVKAQHKGHLPGIIHDRTDSGAGVYIEPQAAVGINNRLTELQSEEDREKKRLLRFLTACVRENAEPLIAAAAVLGHLDLIQARALFGLRRKHNRPEINPDGTLSIRVGKHPILEELMGEGVVPLNIEIGTGTRALIVTGPNTGGKTVALKTVGLLCLMAQAGLFLPSGKGTSLSVFSNVFADIGDEQSLEQSLSTYSGHIRNIAEALGSADERSLVILDELGAGTDPGEGAHLGMAILEKLITAGSLTLTSTHHEALWAFAAVTPAAANASMEFDGSTLRPTYHLIMGVPGKSNAREVARQMGIPEDVVQRSAELQSEGRIGVDQLLADLGDRKGEMEKALRDMADREEKVTALLKDREKELEDLRREKGETITEARKEAEDILGRARQKVKEIIAAAAGDRGEAHRQLHRLKRDLEESLPEEAEETSPLEGLPEIGQKVRLPHLAAEGRVTDVNRVRGTVRVDMGDKVVTLSAGKLSIPPEKSSGKGVKKTSSSYEANTGELSSRRLDIRGMRGDEAVQEVESFLDRAWLAGLEGAEILHGKGTGRLRMVVEEVLSSHPGVKGHQPAPMELGGHGVTVVNFR